MKKIPLVRIFAGIVITGFGVAFLLNYLDIAGFSDIFLRWWPLLIVIFGLLLMAYDRKVMTGAIVAVAGVLWQLDTLELIDVNVWQLIWPALLVIIGLSLIFRGPLRAGPSRQKLSASEREDATAILSGSELISQSDSFRASRVTALLGGVKMDLRQATIAKDATIEIFAFWGGVELIMPKDVVVKCSTANIMGGIENKTGRPSGKDAPVVTVIGNVIMGGVEIKN